MTKILLAPLSAFALFTLTVAPVSANQHAHIQVYNYTDGAISVSCQGHHHDAVGKISSISAYGNKRMSIQGKGKIHCKARDHHNDVIGKANFNITSGDQHSWDILPSHH